MARQPEAKRRFKNLRCRQVAEEIGLRHPRRGSLGWIYVSALSLGVLVAFTLGSQAIERTPVSWALMASLLLWQPVIEELLFRGALQGLLLRSDLGARAVAGTSLANIITSLAFVIFHLVHQPVFWAIAVFFPSLLFGYFRDRSGSILPPLILHIAYNAAFFLPRYTPALA